MNKKDYEKPTMTVVELRLQKVISRTDPMIR